MNEDDRSQTKPNIFPPTHSNKFGVRTFIQRAFYAYSRSAKSFRDFKQRSICDGAKQPGEMFSNAIPMCTEFSICLLLLFSFLDSFARSFLRSSIFVDG